MFGGTNRAVALDGDSHGDAKDVSKILPASGLHMLLLYDRTIPSVLPIDTIVLPEKALSWQLMVSGPPV